jgi:mono/diheme cytochrome c family protein
MRTIHSCRRTAKLLAAGSLLALASANANAETMSLGKWEYNSSCASCHGADGKGDGPVAASPHFTAMPTDLTTLQKENDGVFPVDRMYEIIDGRAEVMLHGTTSGRDMPVWGYRYNQEALEMASKSEMPARPVEPHIYVHTRIMALIDYILSLQEE